MTALELGRRWRGGLCLLAAVLALGLSGAAPAGDRGDHERARQALESGEILPLRTVLERVERDFPGQLVEVELERDDGQWLYEIKLIRSGGEILKLEVDARDGTLLGLEGRVGKDGRKERD
ncbi:PepSY domain-containing protein [Thauera sp. WH-1]|uniref:PepSY domain-containing protein n=1 Tax=Thauera sp. WH-1 TaxID=3398230 RepID=UPI0039FD048F